MKGHTRKDGGSRTTAHAGRRWRDGGLYGGGYPAAGRESVPRPAGPGGPTGACRWPGGSWGRPGVGGRGGQAAGRAGRAELGGLPLAATRSGAAFGGRIGDPDPAPRGGRRDAARFASRLTAALNHPPPGVSVASRGHRDGSDQVGQAVRGRAVRGAGRADQGGAQVPGLDRRRDSRTRPGGPTSGRGSRRKTRWRPKGGVTANPPPAGLVHPPECRRLTARRTGLENRQPQGWQGSTPWHSAPRYRSGNLQRGPIRKREHGARAGPGTVRDNRVRGVRRGSQFPSVGGANGTSLSVSARYAPANNGVWCRAAGEARLPARRRRPGRRQFDDEFGRRPRPVRGPSRSAVRRRPDRGRASGTPWPSTGVGYRDRVFDPATTVWGFLSQVLSDDHSCRDAVARVIAHRAAGGPPACSPNTASYCNARGRLPTGVLRTLARRTAQQLQAGRPGRVEVARPAACSSPTGRTCPCRTPRRTRRPTRSRSASGRASGSRWPGSPCSCRWRPAPATTWRRPVRGQGDRRDHPAAGDVRRRSGPGTWSWPTPCSTTISWPASCGPAGSTSWPGAVRAGRAAGWSDAGRTGRPGLAAAEQAARDEGRAVPRLSEDAC